MYQETAMGRSVANEIFNTLMRSPKKDHVLFIETMIGKRVVVKEHFHGVIVGPNLSPYGAFPASRYPILIKLDSDFYGRLDQTHAFKIDEFTLED